MRSMGLTTDFCLLFATRTLRLLAYGPLSVVLVLYLARAGGANSGSAGLTMTLLGDTALSLLLTTCADRWAAAHARNGFAVDGRRGDRLCYVQRFHRVVLAATIGVISPSGNEVGPFLPDRTSRAGPDRARRAPDHGVCLVQPDRFRCHGHRRTDPRRDCQSGSSTGVSGAAVYRPVILAYAVLGGVLAIMFWRLSPAIESRRQPAEPAARRVLGLHRSQVSSAGCRPCLPWMPSAADSLCRACWPTGSTAALDSNRALSGAIFFGANLLAGISALVAGRLARRIGLVRTMVFTHLPSNVLLMLIPLMPNAYAAIAVLLIRFSISQMDVPTRQAYTMAVVEADERAAAAGSRTSPARWVRRFRRLWRDCWSHRQRCSVPRCFWQAESKLCTTCCCSACSLWRAERGLINPPANTPVICDGLSGCHPPRPAPVTVPPGDTGHCPLAVAERYAIGTGRDGIDNRFLSRSWQRCGTFCSE